MHRSIRTADDVPAMLDRLFTSTISWDAYYADRGKPIPFFEPKHDENLRSVRDFARKEWPCGQCG